MELEKKNEVVPVLLIVEIYAVPIFPVDKNMMA